MEESDFVRWPATDRDHAGEARVSATGRRDTHRQAAHSGDEHIPVCAGDGALVLHETCVPHRLLAAASFAFPGAGADVDGHSEGGAPAAAMHLLAFPGVIASDGGRATVEDPACDAAAGVGCGPRKANVGDAGH